MPSNPRLRAEIEEVIELSTDSISTKDTIKLMDALEIFIQHIAVSTLVVPSNSELTLHEFLDVLDGPYGWKADLEKLIADKVADAYGEGEAHGRISESEYTFENTPKFYTLQEKDHWFKERRTELGRAAHSSRKDTDE